MKAFKKIVLALILAMTAALCLGLAACGSYSLDEGKYTGSYKCHYPADYTITTTGPNAGTTEHHGEHWGAVVTFDVDMHGTIWNLTVEAPEPDADSDNEEYVTYVSAGMSNTFINQFGGWSLAQVMAIDVEVNDSGFPTAIDGDLTIPAGQTAQCGTVILAMQDAISTGTLA